MVELGKYNTLKVLKTVDFGVYLDGGDGEEILMPRAYVPLGCSVGDEVSVFVYLDSEDRIIATTETPRCTVGEFAFLKAVGITTVGAFLDWGLKKDLLVPYREQTVKMKEGLSYVVYVYVDPKTNRIVGTTRLDKYVSGETDGYKQKQEVDVLVVRRTELGYAVIINGKNWGLVYRNEIFGPLRIGQRMKGFVKEVRPDGKIDIRLQRVGREEYEHVAEKVMEALMANDGVVKMGDNTEPEVIYNAFGCSKKTYKKAIGHLYRERKIALTEDGVKLLDRKIQRRSNKQAEI